MSESQSGDDFALLRHWYMTTAQPSATVLRWYRTVGYARHDGVSVDMRAPCALQGDDIEYLPGSKMQIDGRDMTDDEQAAAQRILVQMASDARDALEGQSTLVVVCQ